jgi:hypothetical protein
MIALFLEKMRGKTNNADKDSKSCLYRGTSATSIRAGGHMAFRPNYRRDRLERDRIARARSDEKRRKKEEKTAERKAERAATEGLPDSEQS